MSEPGESSDAGPYRATVVVGAPPRNGLAVAGLLMGLGALVCLAISVVLAPGSVSFLKTLVLGLLVVGGVALSGFGLVLAFTGYKEIERSHGRYSGRSWAVIGMLINVPVLIATIVLTVVWLRNHL